MFVIASYVAGQRGSGGAMRGWLSANCGTERSSITREGRRTSPLRRLSVGSPKGLSQNQRFAVATPQWVVRFVAADECLPRRVNHIGVVKLDG
jgi:hypothetical protein